MWIADPATSRVTVVSAGGRLIRTVQTEMSIERLLPLDGGRFLGFAFAGEKPRFDRFDSLGRVQARVRHPAWMDTVPSLVSELRVAAAPDGRQFAIGSFYSGRLMLLSAGDSVVRDINAVETHAFPRACVLHAIEFPSLSAETGPVGRKHRRRRVRSRSRTGALTLVLRWRQDHRRYHWHTPADLYAA